MSFVISPKDYTVMAEALTTAGLNGAEAEAVVQALFDKGYTLIDERTYRNLYNDANTRGIPD